MDLKTFKMKLSAYGADFSRWEGVDENEAIAFARNTPEAKNLHAQAEKLDQALAAYAVEPPRHAIMSGINSRIGSAGAAGNSAVVMPFPLRIETPPWKVAIGMGMTAAAAMIILIFSTIREDMTIPENETSPEIVAAQDQGQIDAFVSEMASMTDENAQADEILDMLEIALAAPADDTDIDGFLDEMYDTDEENIWEMFYSSVDRP